VVASAVEVEASQIQLDSRLRSQAPSSPIQISV
jgi:hypothetical protein